MLSLKKASLHSLEKFLCGDVVDLAIVSSKYLKRRKLYQVFGLGSSIALKKLAYFYLVFKYFQIEFCISFNAFKFYNTLNNTFACNQGTKKVIKALFLRNHNVQNIQTLNTILSTNLSIINWYTQNKQLFKFNFLSMCVKTTRRNIFFTILNPNGEVIWKISSGLVGMSGKHKRAPEAIRKVLSKLLNFLRINNVVSSFVFRYFFIRSLDTKKVSSIVNLLKKNLIFINYLIYDVRHPHGYMRLRKPRRL